MSQNASAYDTTNRLFNALLPYFGAQAQMPMVYFTPTLGPGGRSIPPGEPAVAGTKGYQPTGYGDTGVIAYPTGSLMLANKGQSGSDILAHEFAHVFQNPALLTSPDRQFQMEGGAEGFTELVRNQLAQVLGLSRPLPYQSGYGALGEQFIQRYGPDHTLYGQFQF